MTIEQINQLDQPGFLRTLGPVFEGGAWVAAAAWERRPFTGLEQLHGVLAEIVRSAPEAQRVALIRAQSNPLTAGTRFGRVVGRVGPESGGEPSSTLSAVDLEAFQKHNTDYRYKFGFPLILSGPPESSATLIAEFERRIRNSPAEELQIATEALCQLAGRRLRDLHISRSKAAGFKVQVVDTSTGLAAEGLVVELWAIRPSGPVRLSAQNIGPDGAPLQPLLTPAELVPGDYELFFRVSDYYARLQPARPDSNGWLVQNIPVRLQIRDIAADHRVTVFCSPAGYSVALSR
jgi:2-oxo-4-hydroxy-4-carboxy-5-ureidoimidazoline decarboxylase